MKETINDAMKQDFSSHAVLGRVLFGISFFLLGLYSILNAKMFATTAPSFVPDIIAPILVIVVGGTFAVAGFGIAVGKRVSHAAVAIALVWATMAIFTNLLSSYFDVREFFIALAFIGAALMLKEQSTADNSDVSHLDDDVRDHEHDILHHHKHDGAHHR